MKKESLVVTFNLTFRNIDEVLCYSNSYIDSLNPSELEKTPHIMCHLFHTRMYYKKKKLIVTQQDDFMINVKTSFFYRQLSLLV